MNVCVVIMSGTTQFLQLSCFFLCTVILIDTSVVFLGPGPVCPVHHPHAGHHWGNIPASACYCWDARIRYVSYTLCVLSNTLEYFLQHVLRSILLFICSPCFLLLSLFPMRGSSLGGLWRTRAVVLGVLDCNGRRSYGPPTLAVIPLSFPLGLWLPLLLYSDIKCIKRIKVCWR